MKFTLQCLGLILWMGGSNAYPDQPPTWPLHALRAKGTWALNSPGGKRFDASGLLLMTNGDLLTLSDAGASLYRVHFDARSNEANLLLLTGYFAPAELKRFAGDKHGHFDCEGIARDEQGRLYVCEEADRWILRCDPASGRVERLAIDWSPVEKFFSTDRNASFEGIAIGQGKLYIANERESPLIIVLDLATLNIVEHFVVTPRTKLLLGFLHYSDLSWFDGKLYVLCRQHRVVLEVDPATHDVLAEFNYRQLEDDLGYTTQFPVGIMEGVAVDRDFIWLVTDNNGLGRGTDAKDIRPTLLKCPRPHRP